MTRRGIRLLMPLALAIIVGLPAAGSPPAGKLLRLGYVLPGAPGAYTTSLSGLRQGLHELGYVEGQHVVLEERYAEGQMERLPDLFAELIRLKVDLLVAPGTVIVRAAQRATTTLPIVAVMGNPVGTGLAESLARPGANLTGMSTLSGEGFSGTWLQLLKEAIPTLSRVAYLWNPTNPVSAANIRLLQRVAPRLGLDIHSVEMSGPDTSSQPSRRFGADGPRR